MNNCYIRLCDDDDDDDDDTTTGKRATSFPVRYIFNSICLAV